MELEYKNEKQKKEQTIGSLSIGDTFVHASPGNPSNIKSAVEHGAIWMKVSIHTPTKEGECWAVNLSKASVHTLSIDHSAFKVKAVTVVMD